MKKVFWLSLLVLGIVGGVAWRWSGPVRVQFTAKINDLPFEAEVVPEVLWVRPGEVVSVTYRIRNNAQLPLEAYGQVAVVPARAKEQVEIFITQCSGLNTFQRSVTSDYLVLIRVSPAGWWGASQIVIQHEFTPAVDR